MAFRRVKGLVWNAARVLREVHEGVTAGFDDAGRFLVQKTRENIAVQGPPHSLPGEFPRRITGELQEKTGYRLKRLRLGVELYNTAAYALWLEYQAGRSFMRRTVSENRAEVRRLVVNGARLRRRP